ncbi:Gfo/Idh/MocA family oxidoreductase [Bradyrhizobium sp. dw_411]|uniref:Gfo/Idh/MocA family oxidoreductase n=1 Tax=Bradyrhizobium sp. dw_411 TaxID=2720082 RepID=UPI001BCFB4BA|nr:Gfo/Idh/MocA family oxidoreductase [Bradyrhizobium sp. dw_411]
MNVAILGSGFGLYGYLPALAALPCRVLLPERYRAVVATRAELSGFAAGIDWVADEHAAIDRAQALVIARRPADQAGLIAEILRQDKLERLLLEKPLAPTPALAAQVQDQIEVSGKMLRMGYMFGFTDWGRDLMGRSPTGNLQIKWTFRAHHYKANLSNWKRSSAEGGGALRFYGIQLISLLADLGFDRVLASGTVAAQPDEAEVWRATLSNHQGARCEVEVDSNSAQTEFLVRAPTLSLAISLPDPFGEASDATQDRRVPILSSLCRDLLTSEQTPHFSYRKTIALWQAIEDVTVHRIGERG